MLSWGSSRHIYITSWKLCGFQSSRKRQGTSTPPVAASTFFWKASDTWSVAKSYPSLFGNEVSCSLVSIMVFRGFSVLFHGFDLSLPPNKELYPYKTPYGPFSRRTAPFSPVWQALLASTGFYFDSASMWGGCGGGDESMSSTKWPWNAFLQLSWGQVSWVCQKGSRNPKTSKQKWQTAWASQKQCWLGQNLSVMPINHLGLFYKRTMGPKKISSRRFWLIVPQDYLLKSPKTTPSRSEELLCIVLYHLLCRCRKCFPARCLGQREQLYRHLDSYRILRGVAHLREE